MKLLLRNKATGQYFLSRGQWTPSRDLARNFVHGDRALMTALEIPTEVELVYAFPDSKFDMTVPIRNGVPSSTEPSGSVKT